MTGDFGLPVFFYGWGGGANRERRKKPFKMAGAGSKEPSVGAIIDSAA